MAFGGIHHATAMTHHRKSSWLELMGGDGQVRQRQATRKTGKTALPDVFSSTRTSRKTTFLRQAGKIMIHFILYVNLHGSLDICFYF